MDPAAEQSAAQMLLGYRIANRPTQKKLARFHVRRIETRASAAMVKEMLARMGS